MITDAERQHLREAMRLLQAIAEQSRSKRLVRRCFRANRELLCVVARATGDNKTA